MGIFLAIVFVVVVVIVAVVGCKKSEEERLRAKFMRLDVFQQHAKNESKIFQRMVCNAKRDKTESSIVVRTTIGYQFNAKQIDGYIFREHDIENLSKKQFRIAYKLLSELVEKDVRASMPIVPTDIAPKISIESEYQDWGAGHDNNNTVYVIKYDAANSYYVKPTKW